MRLTALIKVIFTLLHLRLKRPAEDSGLVRNCSHAFGQDGEFLPGYLEVFDRSADDLFVHTAGVNVGGIPCREAFCRRRWSALSCTKNDFLYTPLSHAAFKTSRPSSSSILNGIQALLPIPMVPTSLRSDFTFYRTWFGHFSDLGAQGLAFSPRI